MRQKQYGINQTKFLSDEELNSLEQTLKKNRGSRDALLIELALATGARASELLAIKSQDLDTKNRTVFIKGLKGSDDADIPLNKDLFERLSTYSRAQKSDLIFNISYVRLNQIWHNYRPVKKKFHSLRHTAAIQLYLRTKDIKLVQMFLRHRSLGNSEIYLRYLYKTNELKRILE